MSLGTRRDIPSYGMNTRTTIVLDAASSAALTDLERLYHCSASEAVRRALVAHRDAVPARAAGRASR